MIRWGLFKLYLFNFFCYIKYILIVEFYNASRIVKFTKPSTVCRVFFLIFFSLYILVMCVCFFFDFFFHGFMFWYLGRTAAAYRRARLKHYYGEETVLHNIWIVSLYRKWFYRFLYGVIVIMKDIIFDIISIIFVMFSWILFSRDVKLGIFSLMKFFIDIISVILFIIARMVRIFLYFFLSLRLIIEYLWYIISISLSLFLYIEYIYKLCIYRYKLKCFLIFWYKIRLYWIDIWIDTWEARVILSFILRYYLDSFIIGSIFLIYAFIYLYIKGCLFFNFVNFLVFVLWSVPKFIRFLVRGFKRIIYYLKYKMKYIFIKHFNGKIYIYYKIYISYYIRGIVKIVILCTRKYIHV